MSQILGKKKQNQSLVLRFYQDHKVNISDFIMRFFQEHKFYQEHKVNISDFCPLYPITNYPWAPAVGQTRTTNISEVS